VRLSLELLEDLRNCIDTILKLEELLKEDREDMPNCINGEVLVEYLRGLEEAQETVASLLASLRTILADE